MESAGVGRGLRPRPIRCRNMVGERVAATCEAREGVIHRERQITRPRLPPPSAPYWALPRLVSGIPRIS